MKNSPTSRFKHLSAKFRRRFTVNKQSTLFWAGAASVSIVLLLTVMVYRAATHLPAGDGGVVSLMVLAAGLGTASLIGVIFYFWLMNVRHAEIMLKNGELLQSILNNVPEMIAWKNDKLEYEGCNRRFAILAGLYDEQLIIGKTDRDLPWSGNHAERFMLSDREVLGSGKPELGIEASYARPDGSEVWIESNTIPLLDKRGNVAGILGSYRDISDRKKFESDLRRSEEQARSTLEFLAMQQFAIDQHAIVSIADSSGNIIYANEKFSLISGFSREELIGKNHRIINSGTHPPSFFAGMWETISEGRVWQGDVCNRNKSGELYWVNSTIVPYLDEQGLPKQYISMRTDITPLKIAQDTLRESNAYTRGILDSSPDAIVGMDGQGDVIEFNPMAEKIFSYSRMDVIGRNMTELIIPERFRESYTHDFQRLVANENPQLLGKRIEMIALHASGREFPVELVVSRYQMGGETFYTGTMHDISERRERNEELRKAHDAALEATRLKSEFLSTMSHEIRTPMNGVIGMTDLLLDTPLDAEQIEFARTIKESGQALLSIINDILDFSKIESGKFEIENIDFSIRQVLEASVDLSAAKAHEKSLSLMSFVDPDIPDHLRGDPTRLRQILLNFVSNAIKFTSEGEVVARASLIRRNADEALVRFEVQDQGIGIPEESQHRLFQPFSQADSSTTRKYGGTGLGLSISKRLAELMNGRIGLNSKEGQGSTFWIELPFHIVTDMPKFRDDRINGNRALILAGSQNDRNIFSSYLSLWGMDTKTVEDYTSAMRLLTATGQRYDLLVIIQPVPDVSLSDAIVSLRAIPALYGLPVLVCLSTLDGNLKATLTQNGADMVLTKPVKQSSLLDAVVSTLHPRGAIKQAEEIVARQATQPAPKASDAMAHHRLILLAEDNVVNQQVALKILHKLGYAAHVVNTGQEAVDAIDALPYALVLMDWQMPVMDGMEAAHLIRHKEKESNHGRRVPIIAMTANAMQGDREMCISAGMDDYISKPIDAMQLKDLLEKWLPAGEAPFLPAAPESIATSLSKVNPTSSPIQMDRLREFFGDDEETIMELLQVFSQSLMQLREEITMAAADRDGKVLSLSHELKGSAANMGATHLAGLAQRMEDQARASDWESVMATYETVDHEIDLIIRSIETRS